MRIKTKSDNRKVMAQAISTFIGKDLHYMGPPTFSYTVGNLIIDRDSVITCEDDSGEEALMQFLKEQGYVETPTEELQVRAPLDAGNQAAVHNLLAMLHARAYLLNRVTRKDTFAVSDEVLDELDQMSDESTVEDVLRAVSANSGRLKGISFDGETVTFTFPLSTDEAKNRAYTELASMMVARAKTAKRVSAEPVIQENEKYYLRIWLIQLGLSGRGSKATRKALLDGLKGHTAFRTKEDAERFSQAQKERRAAAKAERSGDLYEADEP